MNFSLILCTSLFLAHLDTYANHFYEFISDCVEINHERNKISIPENIKHIKLDIGLSYSAPMSQYWLSRETDLLVFGFEPNPFSANSIRNGSKKLHPSHGDPLEVKYINTSFYLIPCALGLAKNNHSIPLYITKMDAGCSSVYEPNNLEVSELVQVPFFSLKDFFDFFPFETHPIIEYIKIDAQGSDLDIVKSAGDYIENHVVYITLEPENLCYKNTINSEEEIEKYMKKIGFIRHVSKDAQDPTFVNSKFIDYIKDHPVMIFQRG